LKKNWQIQRARRSVRWTLGLTLLLWLPATVIMVRNLLIHNFGLFGG